MDELNSLISPCKKLRLEPPVDYDTVRHEQNIVYLENDTVKQEKDTACPPNDTIKHDHHTINLEFDRVKQEKCTVHPEKDTVKPNIAVSLEKDTGGKEDTENVSSMSASNAEAADGHCAHCEQAFTDNNDVSRDLCKQAHIDNATAMVFMDDSCLNNENEVSCIDVSTVILQQTGGNIHPAVGNMTETENVDKTHDMQEVQINSLVLSETCKDFQDTLNVMNDCKKEIETLIENRKCEVETVCSGVKVSAMIKHMESVNRCRNIEQTEYFMQGPAKPELVTDLDESLTSESTDDLNSSVRTVIDMSGQVCDSEMENIENAYVPELSDVNNDLVNEECPDNTLLEDCIEQDLHYEHVYVNVIVNEVNHEHIKSKRKLHLEESVKCAIATDIESVKLNSMEENENNAIQQNDVDCILERLKGDGEEYVENDGNYFCTVETDVNGEKMTTDQALGIQDEDTRTHFSADSKILEPMNSDMISIGLSRIQTITDPLCASTPVPQSISRNDIAKIAGNEPGNFYPVLKTFKPQNSSSQVNAQNKSEPLCTSTPLAKSTQGLRVRDMNIMRGGERHVKFTEKIENMTNVVAIYDDFVNENQLQEYENNIMARNTEKNNKNKVKKEKYASSGTFKRDRESKREAKKMKGVRREKFKEYMGPGLTSGLATENASEVATNSSKIDFVKDSDIQTCMLTEYKGFGLTGPLPDRPLQTSTPMPPKIETDKIRNEQNKFGRNDRDIVEKINTLPRCISGASLGGRPAGTEGMLIDNLGTKDKNPVNVQEVGKVPFGTGIGKKLRQTVSETKFGQKSLSLNARTLTRHTSDLGPRGYQKQNRLTGWLASVEAHKMPMLPLPEHSQPTKAATLRPDEAYPCATSIAKGDNSESNSNTDKSDKSDKLVVDPKVLQNTGQLKVSAYMNFGLLTVHVIQGRQLSTKWKHSCDSFVKLSLLPDDAKKPKCKTDVVQDSNNPMYDEKFSFELNEEDHNKRLMISVWHRDTSAGLNEFLGCMSFGIRHLTNPKKEVNAWYYLLTEDIGRKKHLQVSHRQRSQLKAKYQLSIPAVNKDVWGTEALTLTIRRGKTGYGFSVIEACPVRVGRVDGKSPAEAAGLHPGDIIIRLNKQNVSRSTATSVAKLIKSSNNTLVLELHRPKPVTYEQLENSVWQNNANHGSSTNQCNYDNDLTNNDYRDQSVPQIYTLHDEEDQENTISIDDQTLYPINPHIASLATSTPLPLLARGHRTVQTCEVRKQEAIHRLLSLELDFIDLMHAGMQRYSRPLRHCILSTSHHAALFQNIEKLVTISEYHVKQIHDNAPSSFISEDDTDTSGSSDNNNFLQSVGLIYQSKVHMLCQAYDLYAKGISAANQLLSDLRRSEDFVRFVKDPPLEGNQPSISAFIYRPVQHIRELYKVLQEVFNSTSTDSPDYNCLKQVVEGLQDCSTNITNYSCERVESLSSLTSRDSKVSFTGSMKSRSSTTSCSSASSKGQGHSLQTSKSVDIEVMKIQDRLVFSSNIPVFQLCQDDRHLIFSGDMFKWEGRQWMKIHVYLFTDMILQTVKESDGYLRVIQEPTMLRDIAAMDAQRHHGTEFVLFSSVRLHETGHSGRRKLNFRAPSTEQKMAWKSLIEQRVFAVRGSMDYFSSTSDVSSSSASAIVI